MMTANAIVCDVGTGSLKVGYSKDQAPREIISSVVGRWNNTNTENNNTSTSTSTRTHTDQVQEVVYGNEAIRQRDELQCSFPIEGGVVRKWDDMEILLGHALNTLHKDDNDNNNGNGNDSDNLKRILITEPPLNPHRNKRKMLEILFESMDFESVNIANQSLLVLYARGLLTGMVVDCGEGVTQVVPVYEGYVAPHLIRRHGVVGKTITKYLSKLLTQTSSKMTQGDHLDIVVRDIKETMCYVACDLGQERRLARETTVLVEKYTLPDGTSVKVGQERFECTEAYFEPELVGMECRGLSDFVFDLVQECDIMSRRQYYEHVILSGGSSMFPGMPNRLEKDLKDRYLSDVLKGDESRLNKFKISVEAPSDRQHLVFCGGAILADVQQDRAEFWLTKKEYEELGVEKALEKCQM